MYIIPINGVIGEDFMTDNLLMHLNSAKDSEIIKLVIDSPGGYVDEGLKMRDILLQSDKIIHSTNSGDVMSIAVSLFLTASERTFNPNKGQFLIHNPWGAVEGEADDFEKAANDLKEIEANLIKDYVSITGADKNVLDAFMAENKPLTPEQVSGLGFATIINEQKLKAVAYYKSNKNKMEKVQLNEEHSKQLTAIERGLQKLFGMFKAKNLVVQDVNGAELDFGDSVQTEDEIVEGVSATVDGQAASGAYTMPSGKVLMFENGELMSITNPSDTEEMQKQIEDLKAELETLKANNETVAKEKDEAEKALEETKKEASQLQSDFVAFKAQFSDYKGQSNKPEPDKDSGKKKKFSYSRKN